MKRTYLLALSAILAIVIFSAFKVNGPLPIGSDLPNADAKVKDVQGKTIVLKDARKENGLLVMFTCNTCPYVIKNQERTNAICKFALENNFGVILLNPNELLRDNEDSYKAMQEYAKDQKYNWFYAVDKDHELADAFGANRTPECYLFNKELKLTYHGGIDDNPGDEASVTRIHLKEAMLELVAGKEVSVKESRSVGCSIKRKK
jgi:thioredoxin-related protein